LRGSIRFYARYPRRSLVASTHGWAARKRTPLDGLGERLTPRPRGLRRGHRRHAAEGRRQRLSLVDRLSADSAAHVETPRTLEQVRAMSQEQRDVLIAQLERKHGSVLEWWPHCGGPLPASLLPDASDPASRAGLALRPSGLWKEGRMPISIALIVSRSCVNGGDGLRHLPRRQAPSSDPWAPMIASRARRR
jgi:hypothetical protein